MLEVRGRVFHADAETISTPGNRHSGDESNRRLWDVSGPVTAGATALRWRPPDAQLAMDNARRALERLQRTDDEAESGPTNDDKTSREATTGRSRRPLVRQTVTLRPTTTTHRVHRAVQDSFDVAVNVAVSRRQKAAHAVVYLASERGYEECW